MHGQLTVRLGSIAVNNARARLALLACVALATLALASACSDGEDGGSCTIETEDAVTRVVCDDGTSAVLAGPDAGISSCSVRGCPAERPGYIPAVSTNLTDFCVDK